MLIIIANVHVFYCFDARVSLMPIRACRRLACVVCLMHERAAVRMRARQWRRQFWQAPRSGWTTKTWTGYGSRKLREELALRGMGNVFVDAVGGTGCS